MVTNFSKMSSADLDIWMKKNFISFSPEMTRKEKLEAIQNFLEVSYSKSEEQVLEEIFYKVQDKLDLMKVKMEVIIETLDQNNYFEQVEKLAPTADRTKYNLNRINEFKTASNAEWNEFYEDFSRIQEFWRIFEIWRQRWDISSVWPDRSFEDILDERQKSDSRMIALKNRQKQEEEAFGRVFDFSEEEYWSLSTEILEEISKEAEKELDELINEFIKLPPPKKKSPIKKSPVVDFWDNIANN